MDYVADQLLDTHIWPVPIQSVLEHVDRLTDVASMTTCGSVFHLFTLRRLKKFCFTVLRQLGPTMERTLSNKKNNFHRKYAEDTSFFLI